MKQDERKFTDVESGFPEGGWFLIDDRAPL